MSHARGNGKKTRPHDDYAHDEYGGDHEHDSDSDDDDAHEEDHHEGKKHFHDEHSQHHHHHAKLVGPNGQVIQVNEFDHEPSHGTKPYHTHRAKIFNPETAKDEYRQFYHMGEWTHKTDVSSNDPFAWVLNNKAVTPGVPASSATPLATAPTSRKSHVKQAPPVPVSAAADPSAPPPYSPSSRPHPAYNPSFYASNDRQRQLEERLLNDRRRSEPEKDSCCNSCTIL